MARERYQQAKFDQRSFVTAGHDDDAQKQSPGREAGA
jgi:hypothetical protein